MGKLPSTLLRRPSLATAATSSARLTPSTTSTHLPNPTSHLHAPSAPSSQQIRHATFVPRSRRPYQFTQLVQLSDGSTFTIRTTSPLALYKADKDSRNHILWNPSETSLRNVEVDEAGKLAAFRERYGTGWDLEGPSSSSASASKTEAAAPAAGKVEGAGAAGKEEGVKGEKGDSKKAAAAEAKATPAPAEEEDPFASLVDLISAYAKEDKTVMGGLSAKDQARKEKAGKKK